MRLNKLHNYSYNYKFPKLTLKNCNYMYILGRDSHYSTDPETKKAAVHEQLIYSTDPETNKMAAREPVILYLQRKCLVQLSCLLCPS